jgi:RimJ/RimL family protein N-acetyltransferase
MDVEAFARLHLPALEADAIRFNVHVPALTGAAKAPPPGFRCWTLGPPGHCALQWPGRAILLGVVDEAECRALAAATRNLDYPGVIGADDAPHWFARHATATGAAFAPPIAQRIHVLDRPPRYPGAPGAARAATAADAALLFDWIAAFQREAVPHDPPPTPAEMERAAASGRYFFWIVDGAPVAVAAVARRLSDVGAIAPVYTPPDRRGRGYAGSITAAVVDRLFAEGKRAVCLYTDLGNPISNRCYAKIGFRPYCDSWHYVRVPGA